MGHAGAEEFQVRHGEGQVEDLDQRPLNLPLAPDADRRFAKALIVPPIDPEEETRDTSLPLHAPHGFLDPLHGEEQEDCPTRRVPR